MSFPYTVKSGDTLSSVAQRHGLKSWRDIYYHPENGTFRRKRPNPDRIFPGDVVMIPGVVPPGPPTPLPPPSPPPPRALPLGTRFVIHRMGSATSFAPHAHELFFHITDMANGLIGIYWLQTSGRPMPTVQPPANFASSGRSFVTRAAHAVDKLDCVSAYGSNRMSGRVTSHMVLVLSSGSVQIDDMPHHLIGPGGSILPGTGEVSTAIGGDLRFVKMG